MSYEIDFEKEFEADVKASVEGREIRYKNTDFYVTLVPFSHKEFAGAVRSLQEQYPGVQQESQEYQDKFYGLVGRHIIRGWRGIRQGGLPVPYSAETATKFLKQPAFAQFVTEQAGALANFKAHREEEVLKNS